MKKLLLSAIILQGVLATAQEVHYGAEAGLSVTSFRSNWVGNSYQTKARVGGYIGAYAYKELEKGKLYGELQITSIGTNFARKGGDYSIIAKGSMLMIPIYYQYEVSPKFALNGGGYAGLILGLKGGNDYDSESYNITSNTIDLGLLVGAKYHISEKLDLTGRYNFGLLDVDADNDRNANSIFQIGLSYNLK